MDNSETFFTCQNRPCLNLINGLRTTGFEMSKYLTESPDVYFVFNQVQRKFAKYVTDTLIATSYQNMRNGVDHARQTL